MPIDHTAGLRYGCGVIRAFNGPDRYELIVRKPNSINAVLSHRRFRPIIRPDFMGSFPEMSVQK
jgi:hypothetical protein